MVSGPQFRVLIQKSKSTSSYRSNSNNVNFMPLGPTEGTSLLGHHNENSDQGSTLPLWFEKTLDTISEVLGTSKLHFLLLLLPFALLARPLSWSPIAQFVLSFLSIISLSSLIEFVTQELSSRLGQTLGGLVSATFGNTIEVVFGILALRYDQIQLLQASLLGNVLSNNLFSIGCCFMIGGAYHREQYLNISVVLTMSTIMAVATITMIVPTTIHFIVEHFNLAAGVSDITALSHGAAIVLLLIYCAYLVFQLRTHTELFDDESYQIESEFEEESLNVLPIWAAVITLITSTVLVVLCTRTLMMSIEAVVEKTGSSKVFVGFIIIPFLSNTTTTYTAVTVALIDKMDLAISVSIGSSLQVLLFVTPLLILISWFMGCPLNLEFGMLEVVLLLCSTFVIILILQNGRSTYMDGVLCLGLYAIIAMTMFVYACDTIL